ncbi:MAG TPA: hypothetical protein DEA55_01995 [Rhodospirillaceae bacterium]|nr:hypothetical protein [Rhodospirillaceae bacterium]
MQEDQAGWATAEEITQAYTSLVSDQPITLEMILAAKDVLSRAETYQYSYLKSVIPPMRGIRTELRLSDEVGFGLDDFQEEVTVAGNSFIINKIRNFMKLEDAVQAVDEYHNIYAAGEALGIDMADPEIGRPRKDIWFLVEHSESGVTFSEFTKRYIEMQQLCAADSMRWFHEAAGENPLTMLDAKNVVLSVMFCARAMPVDYHDMDDLAEAVLADIARKYPKGPKFPHSDYEPGCHIGS